MTIRQYTNKRGQTVFKVKAKAKSRTDRGIEAQREKRNIPSLREAKAIEKQLREQVLREVFQKENSGAAWGTICEEWALALHTGKGLIRPVLQTTAIDNTQALLIYTKSWWRLLARDITRAHVRKVIDEMDAMGKSNSRKRAVKNAIHQCFIWGIENERIRGVTQSPAVGIKISREEERKPDILTLTEIKTLLKGARDLEHPWYPVWAMALHTGARSGELHALLWSDIDWENRRLTISKTYNGRLKGTKPTKGGYWREVPISSELEALLKQLKATAGTRTHVLPRFIEWDRGECARVLRKFCAGIGITSVKFHALRACFATQLLRDSIAPAVVMKICGWKDLKTMQRYVRLAGIEIEGATDGLKILPPAAVMGRVVELFGAATPV